MADLLKAIIGVEVKGEQSLNQLTTSVSKTEQSLKKLVPGANQANQSMVNLSRVVQDAPFGFIGIANNIDPLLQSFQSLKASTGSTKEALKALGSSLLGGGGLALGVSLVTSALVVFGDKLFGAGKAAKEAKSSADQLRDSIKGIFSEQAKEATEVGSLISLLKSETETRERKLSAIKELQRIQPEIFSNLKLEGNAVIGLDNAYKSYIENLKTVIAVKIKQAQLEQKIEEQLKKQGVTLTDDEKKLQNFTKTVDEVLLKRAKQAGGAEGLSYVEFIAGKESKRKQDADSLKTEIDNLLADITQLSKGIKVSTLTIKPDKVKIDNFKPFTGNPFGGDIEIVPPPQEVDRQATEFGTMFYTDLKDYFNRKEPIDISLINAVESEKKLEKLRQGFISLGNGIAGVVNPAISEMIDNIGKGMNVFQAFGQAIVSIFKTVISKLIQTAILAAIISAISGGVGNVAKGGMSFIQAFKGAFGGFRAVGGGVNAGRSYIVGERGPELFTPGISGNIIPNNRLGNVNSSFGGMQVSGVLTGRGNDLIAIISAAGRSNTRLG